MVWSEVAITRDADAHIPVAEPRLRPSCFAQLNTNRVPGLRIVPHRITSFHTLLIFTVHQIHYHNHLWDHASIGKLKNLAFERLSWVPYGAQSMQAHFRLDHNVRGKLRSHNQV